MTESRLERVVEGVAPADVSVLIALRALVARDDGVADVERAAWLTALREEYRRWYGPSHGHTESHGEVGAFPEPDVERYLDDHVVRQLREDELLELVPGDDPSGEDGAWRAIRLAPWVLERDRDWTLALLDRRIGAIVEEPHRESIAAVATMQEAEEAAAAPVEAPRAPPIVGGLTLRASGLVKTYRKRRVVNDVDVHVSQGEIVGLLGPNGAGKTTSFYMMVGLIKPDRGTVHIGDRDLTRVPMFRRARAGIGYLAQEPSIFRKLTVEDNVLAILQTLGIPRAEQKRRLERLLDELRIRHVRKSYA
ncbi:MAG TPA: ATP-binding cassette domain-containing protein, partial [Longimicrobium sp.]|nr:ATP-binding cassette domain-containing protein [Longimicrobium sp.]